MYPSKKVRWSHQAVIFQKQYDGIKTFAQRTFINISSNLKYNPGCALSKFHTNVWIIEVTLVNWVPGHFAERTFCRRSFCRTDILANGHFGERTFCRTDSLPKGQLAENRDVISSKCLGL